MITLDTIYTKSYTGLSTDGKPAVNNGDTFFEMDTNKTYVYDAENAEWKQIGGPTTEINSLIST